MSYDVKFGLSISELFVTFDFFLSVKSRVFFEEVCSG